MKSDSFVSVVLVSQHSLATLKDNLVALERDLSVHYSDYEIVVIGQGPVEKFSSQDDAVLKKVPSLRFIQIAARVHADIAWAAALENAIGDFVVMFNPEFDPVSAISETVALSKSGFDVVVGVASQPRTLSYRVFRPVATRVLKMIDYSLPRDATGLRCLSRRAVNAVTSTGRFHHQLVMRIQKTGYPQISYKYSLLQPEQVVTPHSFLSGLRNLLRLIIFNSSSPLRWMSGLGLLGSISAFIFAAYSLLVHLVKGSVAEGWTTTILFMSALFMMQFVMMAFFGEYLGRLLDDRSEQAAYSVVFEKNSEVMVNTDRVNVLNNSLNLDENLVQTGRSR